ncbi:protein TNT, partial [Tupaia chinensis]|uniref:protein TNT n=1 Tax=Tupaia chinensis TaxID=246437 RepID=UPI0003C8F2B6
HSEASQGPLLLDKPIQLPPIFLRGEKEESFSQNTLGPEPSLQSSRLELQPHSQPCHTGATQEPLKVSCSSLGNTQSSESLGQRPGWPRLKECSNASLLSSGYAGDEENSEASLARSPRIVRWNKRLHLKVGGTQPCQLCTTSSPSHVDSQLTSTAHSSTQTGAEK